MDKDIFLNEFGHLAQGPDGIKKLRDLILQLAVQGKLVEQDANDEPASVLLKRLKERRNALLKQGLIKKNKKAGLFPGDNVTFVIPENWCFSTLYEIGSINPRNEADDGSQAGFVPMPLISQVCGGHHSFECKTWGDIKKGYTHFADGDVGLAKITPCFENSKCCVFNGLPNGIGAGTTELHIFRDETKNVLSEYVYLFLKSPYFLKDGKKHMTGSAGQKRVPTDYFSQKPIPVPPLAEQKRIVAKVDELMALCDDLEASQNAHTALKKDCVASTLHHLSEASEKEEIKTNWSIAEGNFNNWFDDLETVKNLRATILQLAVQGKLVEQNPNDEPASVLLEKSDLIRRELEKKKVCKKAQKSICQDNNLTGWLNVSLERVTSKMGSGSTPRGGKNAYVDKGVKFLRSQNVWNEGLKLNGVAFIPEETHQKMSGTQVCANDVLLNITGASIGRSSLVPTDFDTANVSQHVMIVRPVLSELSPFIHLFLISPLTQRSIDSVQVGISREGLSAANAKKFIVPLPPLEEQKRIVSKVDELMSLCYQLESQIKSSEELNRDLMASLVHHMLAA